MEIKIITFKINNQRIIYDNNGILIKEELFFKLIKRYILLKIILLSINVNHPN